MSMHEIEDLVHSSVLVLDAHHPEGDGRLRDWFVALYAFQQQFDCSHTQGRVLDILLRRRHTYRFPVREHPDYARRRDFFDALTGFTELRTFDEENDDFDGYDDWLEDGYVDPPWLYCEAGTALWQRMVDEGRLRGADAIAPRRAALIEVVLAVAAAAEQHGDIELIALWYGLGPETLVHNELPTVEDLGRVPEVVQLRQIMQRTGAWSMPLLDGYRPTDHDLDVLDDDVDSWWYRVPSPTATT